MKITYLELKNFRNYENLILNFGDKVNVIEGKNGFGKTNLIEAIYYLSLAKTWRTNEYLPLIRKKSDSGLIKARIEENNLHRDIEISIIPKGRKIYINGKPARKLSELSKLVNVILFSPGDVDIFKSVPSGRRMFLDTSISKKSLEYFNLIRKYNRLIIERNAILKTENPNLILIQTITDQIIEVSEPISRYRREYINDMNKILSSIVSELYGLDRSVNVVYKPFIKSENNWKDEAKKAYKRSLESDLNKKTTQIGVHREDFSLELDGADIALYGSQGENRLAAIALKITPYFLIEDEGKKPITVLDDIYSELDEEHATRLSNLVSKHLEQVFITTTGACIKGASYIEVSNNKAVRR